MSFLYFDCFSGISGDMTLGALLDLGVETAKLQKEIDKLGITNLSVTATKTSKNSLAGTAIRIDFPTEKQPHRTFSSISSLLEKSTLSPGVKEKSRRIFSLLATVEGKIHGKSPSEVHFHEVGALDSLVDIVGSVIALEMLGVKKIMSSPLPFSRGFVRATHGLLPLPAPATAELCRLKKIPQCKPPLDIQEELVTPTGAAILGALAESFGPPPPMLIQKIGYGAGQKNFPFPNLLRLFLAEKIEDCPASPDDITLEKNLLIETNIDDMNPEHYEHLQNSLFQAGALDVFLTTIQMKKNRPAVKISILTVPEKATTLREIIFRETSSIGVRENLVDKYVLPRTFTQVTTPWGKIRVKISYLDKQIVNKSPEYEDCLTIAQEHGVPLKEVYDTVRSNIDK